MLFIWVFCFPPPICMFHTEEEDDDEPEGEEDFSSAFRTGAAAGLAESPPLLLAYPIT